MRHMAQVNISQAAKLVGKSRTTIHRKINKGELSISNGLIDTSELIRVFGELKSESEQLNVQAVHQVELKDIFDLNNVEDLPFLVKKKTQADKVLDIFLIAGDREIKNAQVRAALYRSTGEELSHDKTSKAITELIRRGNIVAVNRGLYRLAE